MARSVDFPLYQTLFQKAMSFFTTEIAFGWLKAVLL